MPTAYCLLLTAYCSLLTAYCSLPYLRHLLPEEFSQLRERREHILVAFQVSPRWQSQFFGQLRIRWPNIFIAALARQPPIEGTTHGASLFDRRFSDKGAA